jgi:hypothetical protein
MNAKTAYHKLSVMLGLAEEIQLAEAVLVDGTTVKTEGDIVEGATLYVVTPEGDITAPEGMHETQDGQVITVDAAGTILSIEDKAPEAVEPVEPVETPVEAAEVALSLEDIANVIKPFIAQVESLKAELETVRGEFSALKEEPAAGKVKINLSEQKLKEEEKVNARVEYLASLRRKNK